MADPALPADGIEALPEGVHADCDLHPASPPNPPLIDRGPVPPQPCSSKELQQRAATDLARDFGSYALRSEPLLKSPIERRIPPR